MKNKWVLDFTRQIALVGATRVGKSMLLAANFRDTYGAGVWCIDAEGSLKRYQSLTKLKLHYPSRAGTNLPFYIDLEAEQAIYDAANDIGSIAVDSVTKIYSRKSRRATMAADLTADQRKAAGLSSNQFSNMRHKADAIEVLGNLVSLGTDVYYIWHEGEYMNVDNAKMEMRDSISEVERKRLMRSVDMILYFSIHKGKYRIRVAGETRAIGKQPPRTDFYYEDPKGNFWAGAMDRIEQLVYLSFDSPTDAVDWAIFTLGYDKKAEGAGEKLQADMIDLYEQVKTETKATKATDMWFVWIKAIFAEQDRRANNSKNERPVTVTKPEKDPDPKPEKEEKVEVVEPVEREYTDAEKKELQEMTKDLEGAPNGPVDFGPDGNDELPDDDEEPPGGPGNRGGWDDNPAGHREPEPAEVEAPDGERVEVEFRNGDKVPAERVEDFNIFVAKVGNEPYELIMLDRAKTHEQNQPWEMPKTLA